MTQVLVVIVNYFSASDVEKLVEQIQNSAIPSTFALKVKCVDNSGDQEQVDRLNAIQSTVDIDVIANRSNLGFGQAINYAIKESPFDFLCCINPDVRLNGGTLNELLSHTASHLDQGIWGGVTVDNHGNMDYRHAWQEPSLKNAFAWSMGLTKFKLGPEWHDNYRHISQQQTEPYPVDSVSGCCMLVSNTAWKKLNGFDEQFFLYSEEIDLCHRAKPLGFQPTIVPTAKLHHTKHTQEVSQQRLTTLFNSKLLYANKHQKPGYQIVYRVCIALGSLLRSIGAFSKLNISGAKAWFKVFIQSLLFRHTNSVNELK